MGYIGATPYGIGTPTSAQFSLTHQPYFQPISGPTIAGYGLSSLSTPPQVLQLLQILPHQLQQLQILQQQQLLHLQQLLQLVPAQLQQLHQLIQVVPQQIQQLQQQWQPLGPAISGPFGFGLVPPAFGQTPGHVM